MINQYERLESEESEAGANALAASRGFDRNSANRNVNYTLCSRTGHTAATCQEFKVEKRDDGGKRGGNGGNGGGDGKRKGRTANKGGKNHHSPSSNGDDNKIVRSGCYFCEGPHKSSDCPNRTTAPAWTSNGSKSGGMVANVKIIGAGLLENVRSGAALSAGVTTLDEYWVGDSGATESMTADGTGLEDYKRAPPGDRVETADGKLLPVAGYGRLRLLVDQEDGA